MSQERDNTNRGALFGNDRKRPDKQDPDFQGKLNIDGTERWISGWVFVYEKEGQKRKGISLALGKEVEARGGGEKKSKGKFDDMSDDIPF